MAFLAAQFYPMRAETLRRSHPPLSRGPFQRSASTAPDRQALGFPALEQALAFPLCAISCSRPISRSVGQPLTSDSGQRAVGTLYVINAQTDPFVVAEIELREIPLQVCFA